MNTAPIRPARIAVDADGTPRSLDFGDVYHPREGALAQARHVFLAGNGLPARWRGRERFVVLETGFGLGNNFLAAWAAWRASVDACAKLVFIAIEAQPPTRETLAGMARDIELAPLAAELARQWPPLTWNLHRRVFEQGAVELLLAFGDVAAWLPQLDAEVDAFFLDGFAPALNPSMWDQRLFRALARMARPDATAATWTAARTVRDGLRGAGFEVRLAPGSGHKRDIVLARFAPRFSARQTPRRLAARPLAGGSAAEPIVIVGAGLAGCALAAALAGHGRHSLLLERRAAVATEGSGNAAGLLHGVVHAADSRHARFYRAAALAAQCAVQQAIETQGVPGCLAGLLRVDSRPEGRAGLQAVVRRLGLPEDYVRAVDAAEAGALAGVPLASAAWYFPQGGWVDPRRLAQSFLKRAGARAEFRPGAEVASLHREGAAWALRDGDGATLAESSAIVLANAGGAARLLGRPAWPIRIGRGQLTSWPIGPGQQGATLRIPVAGAGYVLPAIDGTLWFGASSQPGDEDPSLRDADQLENLARLASLLGGWPPVDRCRLGGRTGFRWASDDRLPVIGPVPALPTKSAGRRDQPRFAPREPGLFVFTGLGSRGIAASVLGAQILASAITGAPSPVEADLLDAVDPARFQVREFRRGAPMPTDAEADQPPVGPMAGSAGA